MTEAVPAGLFWIINAQPFQQLFKEWDFIMGFKLSSMSMFEVRGLKL